MVTDDERRRVAERLRKAGVYTIVGKRNDGLTLEWNVALMSELAEAVGLKDVIGIEVFDRLADLIEPSDTSHVCRDTVACDRGALLALADEMQGYADGAASGDGYPYVNAGELWSYADRIREACGEEV